MRQEPRKCAILNRQVSFGCLFCGQGQTLAEGWCNLHASSRRGACVLRVMHVGQAASQTHF